MFDIKKYLTENSIPLHERGSQSYMDPQSFETELTFLVEDLSKMLSSILVLLKYASSEDQKAAQRLKIVLKSIREAQKAAKLTAAKFARDRR